MMKKSFLTSFEKIDEQFISSNKIIVYLNDRTITTKSFIVDEDSSLELVIVDFLKSDMDVDLCFKLKERASLNLYLSCLNFENYSKKYNIRVEHNYRDTYSYTKMLGINDSTNKLILDGVSFIKNGAKKANTRQEGKIINLTPTSYSQCSPVLLIDENDVKASHGATIGNYSEKQMYYLKSRGLSEAESKRIIILGLFSPVLALLEKKEWIEETTSYLEGLL